MANEPNAKPPAEGDRAPEFRAVDHTGRPFSSAELRDRPYVLYFYPKANTPG